MISTQTVNRHLSSQYLWLQGGHLPVIILFDISEHDITGGIRSLAASSATAGAAESPPPGRPSEKERLGWFNDI